MIMDANLVFGKDQNVSSSCAATNVLDLCEPGDAVGQELNINAICTKTFGGTLGSGTIQVVLQTGSASSSLSNVLLGAPKTLSSCVAGGTMFKVRVPQGLGRYVGLSYTISGLPAGSGSITSGAITSFMVKDL